MASSIPTLRYADIAVNLADPQFTGSYHSKRKHESDLSSITQRAKERGVEKILITGTSISDSRAALDLAKQYELHCTAGCHPTSTSEIGTYKSGGEEGYLRDLRELIKEDRGEGGSKRIISIGEIGLDYDRLKFAPKETQLHHLPSLLSLSKEFNLPLFLHSRHPEAHVDLVSILKSVGFDETWPGGVVHSFTGSKQEADELIAMGLYIGINGCSMKTPENLDILRHIPLERIMIETDAPWCSITSSHASFPFLPPKDSPLLLSKVNKPEKFVLGQGVKGRMEPCEVPVIAYLIAQVKGVSLEEVARAAWDNTMRLFYPEELGK